MLWSVFIFFQRKHLIFPVLIQRRPTGEHAFTQVVTEGGLAGDDDRRRLNSLEIIVLHGAVKPFEVVQEYAWFINVPAPHQVDGNAEMFMKRPFVVPLHESCWRFPDIVCSCHE